MGEIRKPRHSGRKAAFLKAYAECGNITVAAKIAGTYPRTHRVWMKKDEKYARAFADAKDEARDNLVAEVRRRAVEGWQEPVYQGGKLVGAVRRFDSKLLMFLLKQVDPTFRESYNVQLTGSRGGPIQLTAARALSDEELAAIAAGGGAGTALPPPSAPIPA